MGGEAAHTPTPWRAECPRGINWRIKSGDLFVMETGSVGGVRAEADARLIVRAVNSHERLLAACEAARVFGSQGETHDGLSVSEMPPAPAAGGGAPGG